MRKCIKNKAEVGRRNYAVIYIRFEKMSKTLLDYLASMGGNPEWSLSYLRWQQLRGEIQISDSRAELQERNKGGDAVGEDDSG